MSIALYRGQPRYSRWNIGNMCRTVKWMHGEHHTLIDYRNLFFQYICVKKRFDLNSLSFVHTCHNLFWIFGYVTCFCRVWVNYGDLSCLIGDFWILAGLFMAIWMNSWLIIFDVIVYAISFHLADKDSDVVLCFLEMSHLIHCYVQLHIGILVMSISIYNFVTDMISVYCSLLNNRYVKFVFVHVHCIAT